MGISQKITELKKEIATLDARIESDTATIKQFRSALKAYEKIETAAKAITLPPNVEKK